jgi:hypothetical protein
MWAIQARGTISQVHKRIMRAEAKQYAPAVVQTCILYKEFYNEY